MRSSSRVWLGALLFILPYALVPSGSLSAQQGRSIDLVAGDRSTDGSDRPVPGSLIFQILPASTNVDALKSFAGWMGKNANLKGSELQDAAQRPASTPL